MVDVPAEAEQLVRQADDWEVEVAEEHRCPPDGPNSAYLEDLEAMLMLHRL